MNTFEIFLILFIIWWTFSTMVSVYGIILLSTFKLISEMARVYFFCKTDSEVMGFVQNYKKFKIRKKLFSYGKTYIENKKVSKLFLTFCFLPLLASIIMFLILRVELFQILFLVSFVLFFLNALLVEMGERELKKFEKD